MTPRERFVEAIYPFGHTGQLRDMNKGERIRRLSQAVEAFADAECGTPERGICRARAATGGLTFPQFLVAIDREHAACRASLLKECGLED